MSAITRGAIKAIKFYKHVVHSVEKFIQKCKPEYKVPGLYVIDSIVRQSRHQFGQDKDVFAPRFAKNMQQTFANLFKCPPEDKVSYIKIEVIMRLFLIFVFDIDACTMFLSKIIMFHRAGKDMMVRSGHIDSYRLVYKYLNNRDT